MTGLDPQRYEDHFEELDDCPYVRILRELYGGLVSKDDMFKQTTVIEISDIENLLKALFKVNIDIAHREYFLKIDVPEPSNWWYGYREPPVDIVCDPNASFVCAELGDIVCVWGKDMWVSFEPTVELKFSNLHSDNQLNDDGNLVCSISDRWIPNGIVPVNREILNDDARNINVKYSDFRYLYDYWRSWFGTHVVDAASDYEQLKKMKVGLDDHQNLYEVKPLCLYENT